MQFERFYSLKDSILGSFPHLHHYKIKMLFNYTHDQGLSWCHGEVIAIKNAKKKTVTVKWAEEHVGEGEKSETVQKLSDSKKWNKSQEQEGAWREYLTK
jgi:hypothetical protein